MLDCKNT